MGDLFEKVKTNNLKYKTNNLPNKPVDKFILPALTAGIQNQGLNNYVPEDGATILKNVISISANGANTGATFYQNKEFTILQDAYAIKWIFSDEILTDNQYLFLVGSITKTIYGNYEWTNKAGWQRIKNDQILLPIKNGKIDFSFMENFISELQAARLQELQGYLSVTGLSNYTLNDQEKRAIAELNEIEWGQFNLERLFGKSTRGKRLKSADRISGLLPFVTAGETDTGISAFIGNNVDVFNANTITIDMFGSAKYRNYSYGADDHIAVVHCDHLMKEAVLFLTSAIHKVSYSGQFSYARNFYAKDADELNISLPIKNGIPDYELMSVLGSTIQKLVIEDVVKYTDREIMGYQQVISS